MHMRWPGEPGSSLLGFGAGRDLVTAPDGEPREAAGAELRVTLDPRSREIRAIGTAPAKPALRELVGARGGLRAMLAQAVPEELEAGTVLYLLLDDLAGTSLIAPFVLTRWLTGQAWADRFGARVPPAGVCTGYAEGATAHRVDEPRDRTRPTVELTTPDDPHAWHELPDFEEPTTRRARRIDVWRDPQDEAIQVDAWFQDSASEPDGGRAAVHEYRLTARADPRTHVLTAIEAVAGALPFPECPLAADNLDRLLGTPLKELRRTVPRELRGPAGCTHLNDATRALSEVPAMLAHVSL